MRGGRLAAILLSAAVAIGSISAARADAVPASALLPALDVYIDAVVAGHAAAACAGPKSPAADNAAWDKAKAIFVATLWANDFPIVFVRTAEKRLNAPPPKRPPDCTDRALSGELGPGSQDGWVSAVEVPLKSLNLAIVTQPVDHDAWSKVQNLLIEDSASEKRLLDCVAVSQPAQLPGAVGHWEAMLDQLRRRLTGVGLPRDEVNSALSAADANTLWRRAAPAAEAELRDSCSKDKSWPGRIGTAAADEVAAAIDKLLPPAPSGSHAAAN